MVLDGKLICEEEYSYKYFGSSINFGLTKNKLGLCSANIRPKWSLIWQVGRFVSFFVGDYSFLSVDVDVCGC